MNTIEKFLSAEIRADEFINLIKNDYDLKIDIQNLIPYDARDNPKHEIWEKISYMAFKCYDFNCYKFIIENFSLDDSIGDNLNIHSTIKSFYIYTHPDTIISNLYEEEFGLFLDVAGDRFDGPEVEKTVEKIILNYLDLKPKTKRIKAIKQELIKMFHVEEKVYPRWIQGSEWPMGQKSPMKFITQEKDLNNPEIVHFYFTDVDTNEKRTIDQFY